MLKLVSIWKLEEGYEKSNITNNITNSFWQGVISKLIILLFEKVTSNE